MSMDADYALAISLQQQLNAEDPCYEEAGPEITSDTSFTDLANPDLELSDPTPDVAKLFVQFNKKFFNNTLHQVSVRWSKRMYSCAGVCRYYGKKSGFCDIALSEPLLKLRPRKNLIETLLHEMIHAYLFITESNTDRDGHGPNFLKHMDRINKATNLNISICHSFDDEVNLYLQHWWRCNGLCQRRPPHYGILRRTCNRAPGPNDYWWAQHQSACGGTFIKIKEPESKPKETNKKKVHGKDIRNFFTPDESNDVSKRKRGNTKNNKTTKKTKINEYIFNFEEPNNKKINLKIASSPTDTSVSLSVNITSDSKNVKETVRHFWSNKYDYKTKKGENSKHCNKNNEQPTATATSTYNQPQDNSNVINPASLYTTDLLNQCPICSKNVFKANLDTHLEECLNTTFRDENIEVKNDVIILSDSDDENESLHNLIKPTPCPCCYEIIDAYKMNTHLDKCLN